MTDTPTTDSKAKPVARLGLSINGTDDVEIQLVTEDNRGATVWYRLSAKQAQALHAVLNTLFDDS